MNQLISQRYSPSILQQALSRFNLQSATDLQGFDAYVYECLLGASPYVLKITHDLRQSANELQGELDFMDYLAERNLPVVKPLPSQQNHLVESISDGCGDHFLAFVCQKAPGEVLPDEDQINLPPSQLEMLFHNWGALTGRLHQAAQDYIPRNPTWQRIQWFEEPVIKDFDRLLPPDQILVREKISALFQRLQTLPRDRNGYGLIHCDLHHGNFAIDGSGNLTVFDFGSCLYAWFIIDIAVALYYVLPYPPSRRKERQAYTPYFLHHFMHGYNTAFHLDPFWWTHFSDILKYEQICTYILYFQHWDVSNLTDRQKNILQRYRSAIEEEIPVVDFDFNPQQFS